MSNEPPRTEPDFRVYVQRGNDRLDVTHAVMDVYDIALNSMDFCLRCGHDHERHYGALGRCNFHYPEVCSCAGFVTPA